MKTFVCQVVACSWVAWFAVGCGSDADCVPQASKTCQEGVVYWQDSCGNRGEMFETCACGCTDDHGGCRTCELCGNDRLDPGETCDGDCPADCDDGNACTIDTMTGSAANCNVTCSHTGINQCTDGDGCCPAGCNSQTDSDCSVTCGNGTVEPGETCDGNCPADCNDGNPCTVDTMTGSAQTCSASCSYQPITVCVHGDGCCPAGCNSQTDSDCSASCGNGTVEPGETCDGDCPADCDDGNACTIDTMTGSATNCNVVCGHIGISQCTDGDACCPAGCNNQIDADCSITCGNGIVEPGETCDGNCPADCNDGNPCTVDTMTGSAGNCSAACSHQAVAGCADGDGCCPAGCNSQTDSDCSASCGNGTVEPGETCDGDCPADCDDGIACTIDTMTGSAANCNVVCGHTGITQCTDGDGCCPAGCNSFSDSDCSATCGNGTVEPGETCDGNCPADCDDADPCTVGTMSGSAADCNVVCSYQTVTDCLDDDGCCPSGCDETTDNDCGLVDEPPVAAFTISVTGATSVVLDATASSDAETPDADIELRWDVDNDGTWDHDWSTQRIRTHDYGAAGTYTVVLEVRDGAGQTDSADHQVTLGGIQYVGGTVLTTTWNGIIVVQSDVIVPQGEILTVAAGTQVLFVYVPGDELRLRIQGQLDVNGTVEDPVLFSVYGVQHREPMAWDSMELTGDSSTIEHAVVEYGTDCVHVADAVGITASGLEVRYCDNGLYSTGSSASASFSYVDIHDNLSHGVAVAGWYGGTLNLQNGVIEDNGLAGVYVEEDADSIGLADMTVRGNGGDGLQLTGSSLSVINSGIAANGGAGIRLTGATANITTSDIEDNCPGLLLSGASTATVTLVSLQNNRCEALLVETSDSGQPAVTVHNNNIVGNAVDQAGVAADPGISHASSYAFDGGWLYGPSWSTHDGSPIERMRVYYSEGSYNSWCSGAVFSSVDEPALWSSSTNASIQWVDISAYGASTLIAAIYDTHNGYQASIAINGAFYRSPTVQNQVVVVTAHDQVDCSGNYWATDTPEVSSIVPDDIDTSNPLGAPVPGAGRP